MCSGDGNFGRLAHGWRRPAGTSTSPRRRPASRRSQPRAAPRPAPSFPIGSELFKAAQILSKPFKFFQVSSRWPRPAVQYCRALGPSTTVTVHFDSDSDTPRFDPVLRHGRGGGWALHAAQAPTAGPTTGCFVMWLLCTVALIINNYFTLLIILKTPY